MPLVLFALVVFQIVSCIFFVVVQAGLDYTPSTYALHIAVMTGVHHHTQLFC
jgi:hypothetical protein